MRFAIAVLIVATATFSAVAQSRPRGRDLGIPFPGETGPANAITDVAGIAVGHVTLIEGDGKLVPGRGRSARASRPSFRGRAATGIRCLPRRST